jgi:hypothetical protein
MPPCSEAECCSSTHSYGDFRDDLAANGYAVVKGVIPLERAKSLQQRAFSWLQSFSSAFSLTDQSTWVNANLPVQSKINTFNTYGVVHEKFMWDARTEPLVLDTFAKIYGTPDLLVSFDALNITLPNRADRPSNGKWPHVDQSPLRPGRQCVQGIINLSTAGPLDGSLMVIPRSHLAVEEFFATQTKREDWNSRDFYAFSPEQMAWFDALDMQAIKVLAEPGDLILWDSRTVHWGGEPEKESERIRTVIYASYAPAKLATKETLEAKAAVFNAWGATTHWAHDNIRVRETKTFLEDGTQDPRDRSEPVEKPEMTEQILKLAGMKPY